MQQIKRPMHQRLQCIKSGFRKANKVLDIALILTQRKKVPDRASSKGRAIRQVEILSNKLLTTAFEASLECVTVM